jgi:uncharacterized protein
MFTKIELKNFASFGSATLDLTDTKNSSRKMALIYGANGSGKTSLCYSILLLNDLFKTMDYKDIATYLNEQVKLGDKTKDMPPTEILLSIIEDAKNAGLPTILKNIRMVDCKEDTTISYEFVIKGKKGKYLLSFNDEQLVHESLAYILNERQVNYFDIKPGDYTNINKHIFLRDDFYADVIDNLNKYWGKHSFFSILRHEEMDKSKSFNKGSISDNLDEIIDSFFNISGKINDAKTQDPIRSGLDFRTEDYIEYETRASEKIDKIMSDREKAYNIFFTNSCPTIKSVYFEKKAGENKMMIYHLHCKRMINDKLRDIDFSFESLGNRSMIPLLNGIANAIDGKTVVIDEIDCGIHDKLIQSILSQVKPLIKGQLIMTTHNTTLMNCEDFRKDIFIINEDENGNREIRNINDYDNRTFANNNIQRRYLNGVYKGIPEQADYSFQKITDFLEHR